MVIFIDDLDRCSKENVVDILEAINFLSVSGNCYIVLGMDETWVKTCIENTFPDMAARAQQEAGDGKSFADHYLEKMINIPVAIPSLKPGDTLNLLLPPISVPSKLSPPQKLYRMLSTGLAPYRKFWPLLAAVAIVVLTLQLMPPSLFLPKKESVAANVSLYQWSNVSLENFSMVDGQPEMTLAINAKPTQVAADQPSATPWQLVLEGREDILQQGIRIASLGDKKQAAHLVLKKSVPIKDALATGSAPVSESIAGDKPATLPALQKTALIPGYSKDSYHAYGFIAAFFLSILGGIIFYIVKAPSRFIEDSPYFKEALAIWQPWIRLQQNTPRAIKRYLNIVRYLAMRYKTASNLEDTSLLTRGDISNTTAGQPINNEQEVLREENLVALSAIYEIEPQWLVDGHRRAQLRDGQLGDMLQAKYPQNREGADTDSVLWQRLDQALLDAIQQHQQRFGSHLFSDAVVERFLDINAITPFN